MSVGHTPGPWEARPDNNEQLNVYGPDGLWIALLPYQCVTGIEEQQKLNAKLIVAAPDLAAQLHVAGIGYHLAHVDVGAPFGECSWKRCKDIAAALRAAGVTP